MYNLKNKALKVFLSIVVILVFLEVYLTYHFPSQIEMFQGEKIDFKISFPFTLENLKEIKNTLEITKKNNKNIFNKQYEILPLTKGYGNIRIKLFGFLPLKNIKVNVIDKIYLIPGGHSIGVKLDTKGVIVVAFADIIDEKGIKRNPAKEAGIKKGDIILEINNFEIKDSNHIVELINSMKKEIVKVKIKRNGRIFTTQVKLAKSKEDNLFKLGVWIRDKTAGIGTLTFYEPNTKIFGALGHGITDIDTGFLLPVENGQIMLARISSIQQGKKGVPGEIQGIFFESEDKIGEITKNTQFGIYGVLNNKIKNNIYKGPLPIGLQSEVKEGKAYILTTIEKNKIKKYEIEILKAERQRLPSQKSMIIKVVDKDLLKKTGGIVQGMSGSPIIQNGKIIGAVTHVFINDPTKGYGIYIEWMLKQIDINYFNKNEFAQAN